MCIRDRLRADEVKIGVVAVSIRNYRLETWGHQITLGAATDITGEIWQAACRAFEMCIRDRGYYE